MPGYELRIWAGPNRSVTPDRIEAFEAADDKAAVERMNEFAAELHRTEDVYLFPAGGDRSIASEQGLA